jgi:hypothetical protein
MSRAALFLLAAVAAGGCSREERTPAAPPPVHLSTAHPDANAGAIARFVQSVCIESIDDPGAVERAIGASRWPAEEDPGSVGQMVTVRDLEHGRIAYSAIPFEAPGGRFRDCQVELDGAVAPGLDRMRAALAAVIPAPPPREAAGAPTTTWRWQPDPMRERQLELAATPPRQGGGRPGLSIHVGSTEYTEPPRTPPPADDTPPDLNAAAPAHAATPADDAPPPAPPPARPPSRWGGESSAADANRMRP